MASRFNRYQTSVKTNRRIKTSLWRLLVVGSTRHVNICMEIVFPINDASKCAALCLAGAFVLSNKRDFVSRDCEIPHGRCQTKHDSDIWHDKRHSCLFKMQGKSATPSKTWLLGMVGEKTIALCIHILAVPLLLSAPRLHSFLFLMSSFFQYDVSFPLCGKGSVYIHLLNDWNVSVTVSTEWR